MKRYSRSQRTKEDIKNENLKSTEGMRNFLGDSKILRKGLRKIKAKYQIGKNILKKVRNIQVFYKGKSQT